MNWHPFILLVISLKFRNNNIYNSRVLSKNVFSLTTVIHMAHVETKKLQILIWDIVHQKSFTVKFILSVEALNVL